VRRLALIAPLGLFDPAAPTGDPWGQRPDHAAAMLCAEPENYTRLKAPPPDAEPVEWRIEQVRANEAAARIFWPLGNTRIEKRLRLIKAPTLLLWGEQDRIMPAAYAEVFARSIAGPTEVKTIPGAGHLAELDKPADVAAAVLGFTA
jgi:pimeloyl-ACP methyl ester carboxylesterase